MNTVIFFGMYEQIVTNCCMGICLFINEIIYCKTRYHSHLKVNCSRDYSTLFITSLRKKKNKKHYMLKENIDDVRE